MFSQLKTITAYSQAITPISMNHVLASFFNEHTV